MINACFDTAATRQAGQIVFRWPYPQKDWRENNFYIQAMRHVYKAHDLFQAQATSWGDEASMMFTETLAAIGVK